MIMKSNRGRPKGTIGDLRRTLRDVAQRLVAEGRPGVTWVQAVQASGLTLGRGELERARLTMDNMRRAGELQALPERVRVPGVSRPMTLYAPAPQASAHSAAPAIESVLRTWCGPSQVRQG
jgi:hypothetical protein